eukprot:scaffold180246_cov14-Tisochrysis_lutea.AAC.1
MTSAPGLRCSWVVYWCCKLSDFAGAHWESMLVDRAGGGPITRKEGTSACLPLLQAAVPNLAQSCGML